MIVLLQLSDKHQSIMAKLFIGYDIPPPTPRYQLITVLVALHGTLTTVPFVPNLKSSDLSKKPWVSTFRIKVIA